MDNVDRLLRDMECLPTLPTVATAALAELDRADCDAGEVASLVSLDPVIAARILRLSNSAFFGMEQKAETVEAAIARLGTRECRGLIVTVALMDSFPTLPAPHNAKVFWTLSLAAALMAQKLAVDVGYAQPERAYLAGLVHRLGEAVLAIQFTPRFSSAIATSERDGLPLVVSLTEEFGCDHAALTARILQHWAFAEPIVDAVRSQLSPGSARCDVMLAGIVAAAEGICRDRGLGLCEPGRTARDWLSKLPQELDAVVRRTGFGSIPVYLDSLSNAAEEAIDFARTVF